MKGWEVCENPNWCELGTTAHHDVNNHLQIRILDAEAMSYTH